MPFRRGLFITCMLVAVVAIAAPAFAYDEVSSGKSCIECHGVSNPASGNESFGPHGGYLTTTNKCAACHTVHNAPAGGILLLPAATIKGTCETCHDGTAGGGVYGVLAARVPAVTVAAAHDIDQTNVVPGGASDGGSASTTFSGTSGNLTCTDCHSPHSASVVDLFTGDRARSSGYMALGPTVVSSRLLKQRPTSMPVAAANVTKYGSDWCGACHVGRLSGSGMPNNHPVESTVNPPDSGLADLFYYERIARVTGVGVGTTEIATLGKNNGGYVMPDPRTAHQDGHDPICQQCHEDARSVGNDFVNWPQRLDTSPSEAFTLTAVDGLTTTDNPRFQTFPHESPIAYFLVEDGTTDGFCLNCHAPDQLP